MRGTAVKQKIVVSNFGEFLKYYDFLEEYLQRYSDEINKKLAEGIEKYPEDPYSGEGIYQEYQIFAEYYPNILRKSFITTCYSYLEKELFEICKIQKNLKSLPLDVTDLNGRGIKQAKTYLNKVAGIDFSDNETWNEITNIGKIRNLIVHKDGILDALDKEIRTYIDRRSDISIECATIIIHADYGRHVVNTLGKFHVAISLKMF